LREALSIAPNLPILHRKLADCLEKLGDTKEAKHERDKAAQLEKEN
jgi:Tfp pilus assembly protein PilF